MFSLGEPQSLAKLSSCLSQISRPRQWVSDMGLVFFRKMRFMAGYTLPAPIAIDKNIRKAILGMEFSVIAPCPAHPANVGGIAIDMHTQVGQFEVNGAGLRGGRQHCAAIDQ